MKKTVRTLYIAFGIFVYAAVSAGSACAGSETLLVKTSSVASFQGTWEEIGRQVGETYPDYIIDFGKTMGMVLMFAGPGSGWTAQAYFDEIESVIPQSIKDHLKGLAAGMAAASPLSYDTAWDLVLTQNFATELLNMKKNMTEIPPADQAYERGCTAFAVTSGAGSYLCHNTDATPSGDNIVVIMHWQPANGDYAYVTMDPPGWADVAFALNEKGISVSMNAGNPNMAAKTGLPPNFMIRYVMEHAATLDEAVGCFQDFLSSGKNFGTGGALIHFMDFNTNTMAKLQVRSEMIDVTYGQTAPGGAAYIASANHFLGDFNPDPEYYYESSFKRYERLMQLINETDTFDLNTCWDILSDTNGAEENNNTISRVGNSSTTMFGVIFTPDGLYYTMGPPSLYRKQFGTPPFVSYSELSRSCVTAFTAMPKSWKVILSWATAAGSDVTGFNLYRADAQQGDYSPVNQSLIQAYPEDNAYTVEDTKLKNKTRYYYRLEAIHGDGTSTIHGPVCAAPKLRYGVQ